MSRDKNQKIVALNKESYRDVLYALRELVTQVERGDFGEIEIAGVVLRTREGVVEIFGSGERSSAAEVAVLLYAGFLKATGIATHEP